MSRLIAHVCVLLTCVCAFGQPFAYVSNTPANGVTVIDTRFNIIHGIVPGFSATVKGLAVTRDGSRVYVADYAASEIGVIDAVTNTNVASITIPTKPNSVAVNPDGTRVYAASETGAVYVVNPFTKTIVTTITPPGSNNFEHIILNTAGTRAYVSSQTGGGSVVVLNTVNNTFITAVPTQAVPEYLALNATETTLVVATQAGRVQIDTANNTVTGRDMPSLNLRGVAYRPGGGLYMTSEAGSSISVWNANNTFHTTAGVGMPVRGIAALNSTHALLAAPTNNKVLRFNFSTNSVETTIDMAAAGTPAQIVIAPLRQLAGCIPVFATPGAGAPAQATSDVLSFDLNPACTWSATSNVPWITLEQNAGTGPGFISFNLTANSSTASRTGAIFVNGRRFLVTQAGTVCSYSISPGSKIAPASFDSAIIGVGAPPGCEWSASTDVPWIELPEGADAAVGSGFVILTIAANTSGQRRTGTVFIAGQSFTVTQAASSNAYGCQAFGSGFDFIRSEGLADGLEDLQILCSGPIPPGGATGDIRVTYNVTITSKLTGPTPDDVDVWLILNDVPNPVPGTTAFRGKLAGPNAVRFNDVPLTNVVNGTARFRVVNVRVNGGSVPPFQQAGPIVAAVVQMRSTAFIPMSGDYTLLGVAGPGLSTTVSDVIPLNGGSHQVLPVTFSEMSTAHFRPKDRPAGSTVNFRSESESLFKHANLGAQSGVADTGTRLRLRIPVTAGVRVWAPATLAGSVDARLVSADATGLGGSVIPGTSMFGGMYQELTAVNGFATAVWEVMAADALLRESATAQLVFQGGDTTSITRGLVPSFAPTSTKGAPDATLPVPRFLDPLATPRVVNLRVIPSIQALGTSTSSKLGVREIVGSNYRFGYEVVNDGTDEATNVVVRGNLPPGFSYTSCSRTDGGPCAVSGGEARAEIAALPGGSSVTLNVQATQSADIPGGTVLENSVSASSDQIDADLQSNEASNAFLIDTCSVTLSSSSASISGAGGGGSFTFGSCAYWVAQADVPWIAITSAKSGSGPGNVTFTVSRNNVTSPRTGTIIAAGQTFSVNQGPGDSCTYTLAASSASVTASGAKTTVRLTVTGTGCSWTASSPVSWVQVFPLTGSTTRNVEYNVFPNFSAQVRSVVLTIGGRSFTVTQGASTLNSNARFVQLAYFNFLGRLPSAQEIAQQSAVLNTGTTRGQFILSFYNTEEFNLGGRFIAGLYVGLLNRDAEYGGWLFQRSALATGLVNQTQLVSNFINSDEYKLKFGNPSAADYVTLLYRQVLLREPVASEVSFHVSTSLTPDTNASRVELARRFLNTAEFRDGTGPRLTAFLLYSTLLLREATPGERDVLAQQVAAGTPLINLINGFINSAEFAALVK